MFVPGHNCSPSYLTFCVTDRNYIIDIVINVEFLDDLPNNNNIFISNDNRLYFKSLDRQPDGITFKIGNIIMDNNIFYVTINDKLVRVDKMVVQPNDINLYY